MKETIINHLFEFWEYIGAQGNFLNRGDGYTYTNPEKNSWPNKIFGIDPKIVNLEQLHTKMKNGTLPKSLGVAENENIEKRLLQHNFEQQSVVKAMFLETSKNTAPLDDFATIELVDNDQKAKVFARVSSKSFGYQILPETIISLVRHQKKIRLFLGKHNSEYVSCGIIYHDKNGCSGIHMIGTLPEYRGMGLGKIMTNKLLFEAYRNLSDIVVLVASKSGERIYSKIGFITDGTLKSYTVNN
ncbi:acetyltransferase (GNAT) family protein [Aquimarina sp. MAR_2010_214]|uniref:GNAT family N-acetyltransferase n=1 Tax=Aquimarina sp. MAR_2010_214 TaxID=1250026 RepID=UPI000C70FC42|nr:GNAT family N-acetyltransferase [Aquimarina sp. MAR_2010_214]PKV50275.1 acetyltransferase (GNAT) family protein [Aquimarina sp. MAR_2010_214]